MISAYRYFTSTTAGLSAVMEDPFFAGLRLANKTFKATVSGRMTDVDRVTLRLALERDWRRPAILDAGVSSAATTDLKPLVIG